MFSFIYFFSSYIIVSYYIIYILYIYIYIYIYFGQSHITLLIKLIESHNILNTYKPSFHPSSLPPSDDMGLVFTHIDTI